MIKVIVADDQALLRESIGYILDKDDEIEVVGLAATGQEAIDLCKKNKPDIVLMDIEMPEMNGVEASKQIKAQYPNIKIIILTTFENPDNVMESFIVGASGYVIKSIHHTEMILTIKCVEKGLTVIHESVREIMVDRFLSLANYKTQYIHKLTEKEIEIVKQIAKGKSNKEIAQIHNYSEGTIKNYISKIFEKLDVADRMQVAIFAIENGMI